MIYYTIQHTLLLFQNNDDNNLDQADNANDIRANIYDDLYDNNVYNNDLHATIYKAQRTIMLIYATMTQRTIHTISVI